MAFNFATVICTPAKVLKRIFWFSEGFLFFYSESFSLEDWQDFNLRFRFYDKRTCAYSKDLTNFLILST